MLLLEKYRYALYTLTDEYEKPLHILDLFYNNSNILIHGPKKCGKYNFLMHYFKNILQYDIKLNTVATKLHDIEIEYEVNTHFFVMNPYLYGYNDKTVISVLVKEISSTYDIVNKTRKIIIIKNVDKLSREAISSLRVIIEKNYRTCIFILLSNNISRMTGPILSRCSLIRLQAPSSDSIDKVCNHIVTFEKIKIPIKKLDIIKATKTHIHTILLLIEYYSIFKKCTKIVNYEEYWSNKIIECIVKKPIDLDNIHKIRDIISNIIHNNIDIHDIFIYIIYYFIDDMKKNNDTIHTLLDFAQEYQMNSVKGNRDFLHIEAFIIHVYVIYHNNTKLKV